MRNKQTRPSKVSTIGRGGPSEEQLLHRAFMSKFMKGKLLIWETSKQDCYGFDYPPPHTRTKVIHCHKKKCFGDNKKTNKTKQKKQNKKKNTTRESERKKNNYLDDCLAIIPNKSYKSYYVFLYLCRECPGRRNSIDDGIVLMQMPAYGFYQ